MVEHDLAKVGVAGSNPVSRSLSKANPPQGGFCALGPDGGIGRHAGLKILWPLRPCGFDSRSGYTLHPFNSKGFSCLWELCIRLEISDLMHMRCTFQVHFFCV